MNQNTNVNLIPKFPFSGNLYFSQYDVGRVATINLVEDGSAYTIPSGATVKIQATKPSGLGFSVECTYNGNVVTVVSTETMTNEYGRFPCELRIESGDVLLGTTNFTFNVEKSPHPTNTVDGDSEDIINQITVALNNALSDIQDAKEEAIEEISQSGGGITEAVKVALLNCFSHVAWIDGNGQTYYDALEDALYDVPAPTLTSISAVYTQSGTVYDTDSLDSLKSDLVVTATYRDSSTATVPSADYTLSGTLTVGTSTITVTYEGMTATFNVTVTAETFIYKLSNPTVFDGTNYINTGVQFMNTDISFTAMMKFVNGDNSGDTRATLIHCKNESSPYQGFAIRKNDNLYAFDGQTTSALTLSSYAATENFEIVLVIRHTAGETDYLIDGSVNGLRMGQVTATRGKDPYLTDKPLVIGASLGNNLTSYSRYWIGTLNDFRIKDAVMTDSAVTSYIGS